MASALTDDISTRLTALADRLECARLSLQDTSSAGSVRVQADGFLGATSQHLAAVAAVLAPVALRLDGGPEQVRDLLENIKRLERSLVRAKARVYGQAQSARRRWDDVWQDARENLVRVAASEEAIIALLEEQVDAAVLAELASRLAWATRQAQTRPHPHMPHLGVLGRVARRVCATTDRVWDELEGRVTTSLPHAS